MFAADPVPFGPFTKGVNNRLPSFALGRDQLRNAVNVDIDSTGHLHRRQGAAKMVTAATARNLWFDGEDGPGYFADGAILKRFNPVGLGPYPTEDVAAVTAGAALAMVRHAGNVYWSDGVLTGQIVNGVNQSWGIAPPSNDPVLSQISGGLFDGYYQITYTYVRASGEESGAEIGAQIQISHTDRTQDGTAGIQVTGIVASADPTVAAIKVYCSATNGTVLFRVATLTNANGSLNIPYVDEIAGETLSTQFITQPPAGSILASHGSRIYVASNNFLYYSERFAPGWFSRAFGFLPFPDPITIVLPVADGMFVHTTKAHYFLQGMDPDSQQISPLLPYGALAGSGVTIRNDVSSVAWVTPRGIVIGGQGGKVKAVQEEQVAVELAAGGILGYREMNGMRQLVSVLTGAQSSGMAHKDYTEQEARRVATILPLG